METRRSLIIDGLELILRGLKAATDESGLYIFRPSAVVVTFAG